MSVSPTTKKIIIDVAIFIASQAAAWYAFQWALSSYGYEGSREVKEKTDGSAEEAWTCKTEIGRI